MKGKPKLPPTPEHQVLIRMFQKALSGCGRSYGALEYTTGISRSGVHHFVNGTGRRFPNTDKYVKLVSALGGDPASPEWFNAYKAAADSYGKPVKMKAILKPGPGATGVRFPAPGGGFNGGSRPSGGRGRTSGDVVGLSGEAASVRTGSVTGVVSDQASSAVPARKARATRQMNIRASKRRLRVRYVLVILSWLVLIPSFVTYGWLQYKHERLPGSRGTAGPTTNVAIVTRTSVPNGINVYDTTKAKHVVRVVMPGDHLANACRVPRAHSERQWVKVPAPVGNRYGYLDARAVDNAERLVVCRVTRSPSAVTVP